MAAVPNFGALAQQQNDANNTATNLTNQANRPNQYNPLGSLTWSQDGSGNWTQSSNLSGGAQNLFNTALSGQQNLAGTIGAGISTDGLGGWGSDPRAGLMGFGATDLTSNLGAMPQVGQYNQEVIDAWGRLQQPDLDKNAAATRARMAAMGLTQGSAINNNSERLIGNTYGTARDNAILKGYEQGNTEYTQALQGRSQRFNENLGESQNQTAQRNQQFGENSSWSKQQDAQRAAQFGERSTAFNAALAGNTNLQAQMKGLNPNDWAAKVPTSAAYIPQTIYGAAQDTFAAQRQNENADIAQRNADRANTASMVNTGLNAVGGLSGLGSAASGAWNWGKGLFGDSGSGYNYGSYGGWGDAGGLTNGGGSGGLTDWGSMGQGNYFSGGSGMWDFSNPYEGVGGYTGGGFDTSMVGNW